MYEIIAKPPEVLHTSFKLAVPYTISVALHNL